MKFTSSSLIATGILAAGTLLAQAPPVEGVPEVSHHAQARQRPAGTWQDRMVRRLTMRLNLTADQQTKVRGMLKTAREQDKGLRAKYRDERKALWAAVKTNSTAQIDQITQENAQLNTQMRASHLKTIAGIYSILTPDQKMKFDHDFNRSNAAAARHARTS